MAEKSFIQASVPKEKGPARHFETTGLAMTAYRIRDGKPEVEEIHTPQTTLQRVHEVMHARHSTGHGAAADYPGVNRDVAEIVEDCRLHLRHWPWPHGTTPPEISKDISDALNAELAQAKDERAKKLHPFARFGTRLRAWAVSRGANARMNNVVFDNKDQLNLASELLREIEKGNHQYAAALIHKMFFEDEDEEKKAEKAEKYKITPESGPPVKKTPKPAEPNPIEEIIAKRAGRPPKCVIEILPLTEPTTGTTDGWRMATTGSRIHRPSLRRPVLPQRLFMKRSPQEPGGAIIFDASGSMRVTTEVAIECCRRAPTAAVAVYRGDDSTHGKIWVFAYNGMRAKDLGKDFDGFPQGNSVDGPAMDWLLAQDGPHIMVTDRQFCGAHDSHHQIMRLKKFEETGQITVYESYMAFMKAYPVSERAA